VLFRQLVDDDLGCASYLIGDETAGEAVVVDPAYAIEPYLEEAERAGVRIVRVLETHTHADHVSGHGRLALEHGLPVSIHALADPAFPFEPVEDGQELRVGSLAIRVLHTPGHRPEHCCYLVEGHLLTGDSLLIGDKCGAHTFPYIEVRNSTAHMEHEASTSKIGEDQLFYLKQRGIKTEDAVSMIVNGFCKQVFKELPMEFAVEAQKLLSVILEGSVG